jgi:hypothetical protein
MSIKWLKRGRNYTAFLNHVNNLENVNNSTNLQNVISGNASFNILFTD